MEEIDGCSYTNDRDEFIDIDEDEYYNPRGNNEEEGEEEVTLEKEIPIFTCNKLEFQYVLEEGIKQVVSSTEHLFIVTAKNTIIIYDEDRKMNREIELKLSSKNDIYKIFVDPLRFHLIVSTLNGDNYYINLESINNSKKSKQNPIILLTKLKNLLIESIGWNSLNQEMETTDTILIGTKSSCIYELKIDINIKNDCTKIFKLLFDFNTRIDILVQAGPITGIYIEEIENIKYIFIATPDRLFQFYGEKKNIFEIFDKYINEKKLNYIEMPYSNHSNSNKMNPNYGQFEIFKKKKKMYSFCWLSFSGICHGLFSKERTIEKDNYEIIQFDNKIKNIISISISEYHIYLLYENKIEILMNPSNLITNEQISIDSIPIVFKKEFSLNQIQLKLMFKDENEEIFLNSSSSIFRILIDDETRNVWKLYLEKAINPNTSKLEYFDKAYELCFDNDKNSDLVLISKGDYLYSKNRFDEAADIYSRCSKSFEQISISFFNHKDSLLRYLLNKLKVLKMKRKNENENLTQLICLSTWITEIYLDKMNQIEFENYSENLSMNQSIGMGNNMGNNMGSSMSSSMSSMNNNMSSSNMSNNSNPDNIEKIERIKKQFRNFLSEYLTFLNEDITFRLISSHGQIEELIYFSKLIKDYEKVIYQYLIENKYRESLELLSKYCKEDKYSIHFYKFSPILIEYLPNEMVKVLMQNKHLDAGKLIPALMRCINNGKMDNIISYLEWLILKNNNKDPAIHNLLLNLYAKKGDDNKLLSFLNFESSGDENYYDMKYALRICNEFKKYEACARLYSMMELYEDSINISLLNNDIKLAKEIVNESSIEDEELIKKLWIKIAKFVIEKENKVQNVIEFLKDTDKIKLEDILPFFPDFILIDNFRNQICDALQEYKDEIEELKQDMIDSTKNAKSIREDIHQLKYSFGFITKTSKCSAENCYQTILSREFYLFPCEHMFHSNCLINEIKKHVSTSKIQKIEELLEIKKLNPSNQQNIDLLEQLISKECPLCGDIMISSISKEFILNDSNQSLDDVNWNLQK
eukprot:gene10520-3042_t